jgi:intergrase/recombinase
MAHKLRPYGQNSSPIRVLVGLRPSEVVESMRLINDITNYSRLITILRRCDFTALQIPQFLRTTKKAYLSFVSPEIISNVSSSSSNITDKISSSNAIKLSCRRKGIACDLRLCRKVHGYWLHQYNVTADEVDFLQGRVSTSVFSRHYLTPDSSLRTSVLDAFETPPQQLMMRIE